MILKLGLQQLLDALLDGHLIVDEDGKVWGVNQQLAELSGYTAEELLSLGLEDLLPEEHRAGHPARRARYSARPMARTMGAGKTLSIRHKDGSGIPVDISLSPMTLKGHPYVVVAIRDARDRLQAEKSRQDLESMARQLFLRNAAGSFRTTLEGELLECNDAMASMLGYESPEELQRQRASSFYVTPGFRDAWLARLRETGVAMNDELELRRKDGTVLWALENSILVDDPTSETPVVMGTLIDITRLKEQEDRLEQLAHHDFLTGLPNRRLMKERAEAVFEMAHRRGGKAALICCDLRRFKQINDSLGHKAGDEVLTEVASRLTANSRTEDTVIRLGGDEFAVLLPNVTDEGDALAGAHRLATFLDEPFDVEGQSMQLDASFGVAMYPDDGGNIEELLSCADHAMYETSREGRKEVQLYSAVATDGRDKMLAREERFRRALDEDELTLFYQPIVRLGTGAVAAEALVRWNHPTRGLVPAREFIELAEYTGLIAELDQWVLQAVVEDVRSLNTPIKPEWVSLNLSGSSIAHPAFVSRVISALEAGAVDGSRLVLELTEGVAVRDPKGVGSLLRTLCEAGLRVVLDDFGVGESALSLLRHLPVHFLKMDASLMPELLTSESSQSLVQGIIGLAHGLRLQVIAKGVETQEQYEWLATAGCDYAQGWWTGRPAPASEAFSPLQCVLDSQASEPSQASSTPRASRRVDR